MKKLKEDITEFYYYKIKGSGGTTYIPRGAKFSEEELDMFFEYPKRRDGKLDMRYRTCKLHRLLKE